MPETILIVALALVLGAAKFLLVAVLVYSGLFAFLYALSPGGGHRRPRRQRRTLAQVLGDEVALICSHLNKD